jgi:peptidoglycan/LPS O-acetylase OafA/YrhL
MASQSRIYAPGLDGLRAVAVLAVLTYHLHSGWLSGGFLGVDVFFVISGYLITDLLLAEHRRRQAIDLPHFWLRRARRLLPALGVMLVTVTTIAVLTGTGLDDFRGDLIAAVTYTSNWHSIAGNASYFAQFGPPPLLTHLWSLSVEEQFYLLWPLLLIAVVARIGRTGRRALLIAAGALASTVAMSLLFVPGSDPSRVYYGTDTHAMGLLVGAALAAALPSGRLQQRSVAARHIVYDRAGAIGLAGVVAAFVLVDGSGEFVYRGGFLLVSAAAGLAVIAAFVPGSVLGRILGMRPLRWLGRRSYGVYLWHLPVLVFGEEWVGRQTLPVQAAEVAIAIAAAAASWRLVEEPIRRDGFTATAHRVGRSLRIRTAPLPHSVLAWGVTGTAVLACVGIVAVGAPDGVRQQIAAGKKAAAAGPLISNSPSSAALDPTVSAKSGGAADPASRATTTPSPAPSPTSPTSPPTTAKPSTAPPTATKPSAGKSTAAEPTATSIGPTKASPATPSTHPPTTQPDLTGAGVTAIGDSVMLAAAPALRAEFPEMVINAEVGRQAYNTVTLVQQLARNGQLGSVVIIDLGTNGEFPATCLTAMLDAIGPHRTVLLVNVFVNRTWAAEVNATLAAAAKDQPNVRLVDWRDAIAKHQDLLYSDHVHPEPAGAKLYASLIAKALPASAS